MQQGCWTHFTVYPNPAGRHCPHPVSQHPPPDSPHLAVARLRGTILRVRGDLGLWVLIHRHRLHCQQGLWGERQACGFRPGAPHKAPRLLMPALPPRRCGGGRRRIPEPWAGPGGLPAAWGCHHALGL